MTADRRPTMSEPQAKLTYQRSQWPHVGLAEHEQAHQHRQREAVEEYVTENLAFMAVPTRRRGRDDDAYVTGVELTVDGGWTQV